jgi:hypothetical protein
LSFHLILATNPFPSVGCSWNFILCHS